jgi:hypothetical protein
MENAEFTRKTAFGVGAYQISSRIRWGDALPNDLSI